jgi:hypothetical protein
VRRASIIAQIVHPPFQFDFIAQCPVLVMRGLDPRIHQKRLFKKMDCRVKPGNDEYCRPFRSRMSEATSGA